MVPAINWGTVLTSAATAFVVTLAVEYLAKPRLEARKERILDSLRVRRELLAAIVTISWCASFILLEVPKDDDPEVHRTFRDERQRHYERMRAQVQSLVDDAGRYARVYGPPVRDLVLQYLTCLSGTVLSPRTRHRQAEIVKSLATPIAMILDGPLWRPLARLRSVWEFRRLIAETHERVEDDKKPRPRV